jgi:hypothetical protein
LFTLRSFRKFFVITIIAAGVLAVGSMAIGAMMTLDAGISATDNGPPTATTKVSSRATINSIAQKNSGIAAHEIAAAILQKSITHYAASAIDSDGTQMCAATISARYNVGTLELNRALSVPTVYESRKLPPVLVATSGFKNTYNGRGMIKGPMATVARASSPAT